MSNFDSLSVPADVMTERAVLGAILLDNDLYADAATHITRDDFYLESHRTLYKRIAGMLDAHMVVDIVTLSEVLRKNQELESIGGVAYICFLTEGLPRRLSIEDWAKILKDKSILRQIMNVGSSAVLQASDEQDTPLDVLNQLEHRLHEIGQKTVAAGLTSAGDILISAIPSVDELFRKRDITGLRTHYPDIDRYTCGLQKQDLIVIAARPSMGKTAFAVNIGQRAAIQGGNSVAIFSLEMSKEALLKRMISTESRIPLRKIQTGSIPADERDSIFTAINQIAEAKIFIDDTASISLAELRAKAVRQKRSPAGLDLIIVDYIQLMSAVHTGSRLRYENRTQEVSAISRGLKAIAKELDVPVIALSQLSRANEQRMDKRPFLSDLRESGSIEQDADVVAFIHRESYYCRDEHGEEDAKKRHEAELIFAKQRNGPTGTVNLIYMGETVSFEDVSMRLLARDDYGEAA